MLQLKFEHGTSEIQVRHVTVELTCLTAVDGLTNGCCISHAQADLYELSCIPVAVLSE
jgi:hypothetical protein